MSSAVQLRNEQLRVSHDPAYTSALGWRAVVIVVLHVMFLVWLTTHIIGATHHDSLYRGSNSGVPYRNPYRGAFWGRLLWGVSFAAFLVVLRAHHENRRSDMLYTLLGLLIFVTIVFTAFFTVTLWVDWARYADCSQPPRDSAPVDWNDACYDNPANPNDPAFRGSKWARYKPVTRKQPSDLKRYSPWVVGFVVYHVILLGFVLAVSWFVYDFYTVWVAARLVEARPLYPPTYSNSALIGTYMRSGPVHVRANATSARIGLALKDSCAPKRVKTGKGRNGHGQARVGAEVRTTSGRATHGAVRRRRGP